MMEILAVINKVLDLKIVQWALLALFAMQLIGNMWIGFKYNALRLENAILKNTAADLNAALNVQNNRIVEIGKLYEDQKLIMAGSIREAGRIAKESRKILDGIKDIKLEGTCDEKVKQAVGILNAK